MRKTILLAATFSLAMACSAQYTVPDGTALYFPFDNPETALDSFGSVRARLLPAGGAPGFRHDGRTGGCAYFDGQSSLRLAEIPAALPSGASPYTVAAWVRADADCHPSGGWVSYGARGNSNGNSFRLNAGGLQNYWNGRDLNVPGVAAGDGRWHHVAGTWDGSERRLYCDGRLVASDRPRPPDAGRDVFMVGATMHDRPFKGRVDELIVAARAFGADEIAALSRDGVARSGVRTPTAADDEAVVGEGGFVVPKFRPLDLSCAAAEKEGWTLSFRFNADGLGESATLVEVPGAVRVGFRFAGVDKSTEELDVRFGNYLNYPAADGKCPVIEASIAGLSTIGVPLGYLKRPGGEHLVTVRRGADAHWFMTVDEDGYDEDGLKKPIEWKGEPKAAVFSDRVKGLKMSVPAIPRPVRPDERLITRPIHFWTPDGHNTWVGDVVVGTFKGRFHVFYLYDRRHHASKSGAGGHYFEHFSSPDLVHWYEHPTAIGLDEWWQTLGTGTPFVWKGRLCLAYGLHTTRFMKAEETTEPFLKEYFKEHGDTGCFDFSELKGYPLGGSFAVSDDAIHFKRTNKLIHSAQNPTVYNRADGRLGFVNSYGGIHGMYVSDDGPWGWKLEDDKIPVSGDCPCEFEWNGHHYLIQGFTRMAYNPDGKPGHWTSWTQTGDDVYDGLCVPMVAPWEGNRRIIAGWVVHPNGWGGWFGIHELVQYPDGKLGVKWLPEAPPPGDIHEYDCRPGEKFAVRFAGEAGPALEFSVDARLGRAQYGNVRPDGTVPRMNSNAERERAGNNEAYKRHNGPPGSADEYAIERIRGLDRPFKVRLAVYYDKKSDVTLFDAEIAGQRAMICRRRGKYAPVR